MSSSNVQYLEFSFHIYLFRQVKLFKLFGHCEKTRTKKEDDEILTKLNALGLQNYFMLYCGKNERMSILESNKVI